MKKYSMAAVRQRYLQCEHLVQAGQTYRQIGALFGVNRWVVSGWLIRGRRLITKYETYARRAQRDGEIMRRPGRRSAQVPQRCEERV